MQRNDESGARAVPGEPLNEVWEFDTRPSKCDELVDLEAGRAARGAIIERQRATHAIECS
jgi:hypothetical protein